MYIPNYSIGDIVAIKQNGENNLIVDILYKKKYPSDTEYHFLELATGRFFMWTAIHIDNFIRLVA